MKGVVVVASTGIGIGCDQMSCYLPPLMGGGGEQVTVVSKCLADVLLDKLWIIALHDRGDDNKEKHNIVMADVAQ
jgi:hypothetical protein